MMVRFLRLAGYAIALGWVWSGAAAAQSPEQQVIEMNNTAMEAYTNLDIDTAGSTLERALDIAARGQVPAPVQARTHANMAVVYIGGVGDDQQGLTHFVRAVCLDPDLQLDPLTTTPDIQTVFEVAKQRAAEGGCPSGAQPPSEAPAPAPEVAPTQAAPATGLLHQPPAEQLSQAPLPIYAEYPAGGVEEMFLYYQGTGMDTYKRYSMMPYGTGWAYQVSCQDVWEPQATYYIAAVDEDGQVMATAGTALDPIVVPVVSKLSGEAPSLPGSEPPGQCLVEECPPGVAGCEQTGVAAIGDACTISSECQSGLACSGGECVLVTPEGVDEDEPSEPGEFQSGFVQAGFTLGWGLAQAGMVADAPPSDRADIWINPDAPRDMRVFNLRGSSWVPDADSQDAFTGTMDEAELDECEADGIATQPGETPSRFCARVDTAGLVPTFATRAALGYFIVPRLSLAVIGRLQFSAGEGTLSSLLVGGRAEYMVTEPRGKGFMFSVFAGGTVGQIQIQPPPEQESQAAPHVISGLGGAHLGFGLRYRVHENFGFVLAPEADVQFPSFLFNLDITLGPEVAF